MEVLLLQDTKYFAPLHTACTAHTQYLCVSILLNTQYYFDIRYRLYCMLKTSKQKQQQPTPTHWCPRMYWYPPSVIFFSFVFPFLFGNIFLLMNWVLSFRFLSSGTLMHVIGRMSSRYRWPYIYSVFLPFFDITSDLTELLNKWYDSWSLFNRDPYSVLKDQGSRALSLCSVLSIDEYHDDCTKYFH